MDDTRSLMAFDRMVRIGGATSVTEIPAGLVIRHSGLPTLHHLNALLLDAPLAPELRDPLALTSLADEALAGLGHRHVVLDDADAAEEIAAALALNGWAQQRVLLMLRVREPDRTPQPGLARRLTAEEAHALQLEITAAEAPGSKGAVADALVRMLVRGQEALRAGTRSLVFGSALESGPTASMCTLFAGDGVAMIEEVGTLERFRGHGLARAVVSAAVDAALELGCERIFVPADADDWPQLLYLKLGFEPVARQVSFTLRAPGDARR
ncbi:MAG TPA: GNAT family N-acetyltransferase [Solirubrobacteraceae bacterium]|nr:GNAT family N-acetyltransferase [Solirubrobacteraceae bacterium]